VRESSEGIKLVDQMKEKKSEGIKSRDQVKKSSEGIK